MPLNSLIRHRGARNLTSSAEGCRRRPPRFLARLGELSWRGVREGSAGSVSQLHQWQTSGYKRPQNRPESRLWRKQVNPPFGGGPPGLVPRATRDENGRAVGSKGVRFALVPASSKVNLRRRLTGTTSCRPARREHVGECL